MAAPDVLEALDRVAEGGLAWPSELREQAQAWEEEIAVRLRGLEPKHWQVWIGVLRGLSNRKLAAGLGCSQRTVERRLSDLYVALGVAGRPAAIRAAWQWGLVKVVGGELHRSPVISEVFKPVVISRLPPFPATSILPPQLP